MKTTKKLLALALVLVLMMGLSISALAANPDEATTNLGTITITVAADQSNPDLDTTDETYTGYLIMKAEKTTDGAHVSYYVDSTSPWLRVLSSSPLNEHFTFTDSADHTKTYVALKEGDAWANDGKALADALLANKPADAAATPLAVGANSGLTPGYWLIDSTMGTNLIAATTDFKVEEKNSYPSIEKKVDLASAEIGQTLTYTLTVTVPETAKQAITLTDTLAAGVTFIEGTGDNAAKVSASGQTITVSFTADEVKAAAGGTLVVTYTAKLNKDAVIGQKSGEVIEGVATGYATDGNFNEVYLTYSHFKSQTIGVDTDTFSVVISKVGDDKKPLAGAEFELRSSTENGAAAMKFSEVTAGTDGAYVVDPAGTITTLKTTADGKLTINGLDAKTYYLRETKVPEGYNAPAKDFDVVVTKGENATELDVVNNAGTILPSTGGIGTTIFYILGTVLVLGAAVVLVAKRRVHE